MDGMDAKTRLNQFCQRFCVRPVTKMDIVYSTTKFGNNQYQAIVKLNCMEGQEYAGELSANPKEAEKSAAQQAMQAYSTVLSQLPPLRAGQKKKKPAASGDGAVKKPIPEGENPAMTDKVKLNALCMKIAKRALQKGETLYETRQMGIGKAPTGYQTTVRLVCLPGEWANKMFAGQVCQNKQSAEQSAAGIALAAMLLDPELAEAAAKAPEKKKAERPEGGKGKGKGWGKGDHFSDQKSGFHRESSAFSVSRQTFLPTEKGAGPSRLASKPSICLLCWLEQELRAERFPEPVVRAIVDGASAGTDCAKFGETFEHTPDGRSHISKWSVWTRGCGDVAELAMLCTNVSFQTAKVIERFEEVQEPIVVTRSFRRAVGNLQRVEEGLPPNVTKSFRLAAGNLPRVEEGFPRNVGTRTIRRPLFREHVVNSADVEAIRRYVEHQVCCDALDTFGCSEDSGASKF
ncbi:unnamed protein product [Polarella glacialis]|uniref:DRBM domain-containing protein n=1 Tax=Polarella glacialis TaxID=89957 RepID=A0A813GQH0_POLGL|nr:unnamed protein product [Polarella glacialis]